MSEARGSRQKEYLSQRNRQVKIGAKVARAHPSGKPGVCDMGNDMPGVYKSLMVRMCEKH